jgi:tetratricopeptide (TPR) repeat protein
MGSAQGYIMRHMARSLAVWIIAAGLAVGLAVPRVTAQELAAQGRAQLEARQQSLFQQQLHDPANLDVMFAYADVSARLGDNEAAVTALERMLLFNPNLLQVDLELGALYFRMGAFEVARRYFSKVVTANPPPEVKARVDRYLAQIAVETEPQRLIGYVLFGAQYQSDANVGPGSPLIQSPLGPVLLNNQFVKRSDTNIFGAGALLYSYDLGTQNRDAIEVTGTGFINHYFSISRLDLGLGEITAGPRFNFPDLSPDIANASFKPYAIVNDVGLGRDQYFYTLGGGFEAAARVWNDLSAKALFEVRHKTFSNAPDRPLSTGFDGTDKLVSLQFNKPVTANSDLAFGFDFVDQSTRFSFYSNKAYAGTLGYRIRYDDPTGNQSRPWETSFFAGRIWDDYATPDPCCITGSGFSERVDRRWRFGITQTFQIADNVAVILQLQRDIVSSNLPLYSYTSNSVLIAPRIRF